MQKIKWVKCKEKYSNTYFVAEDKSEYFLRVDTVGSKSMNSLARTVERIDHATYLKWLCEKTDPTTS